MPDWSFDLPLRLLVIAPHPDDESLGCGGLVAQQMQLGGQAHIVFVTDGGASHANSHAWTRERLSEQRQKEAETALAILGVGSRARTFLRLQDADMPPPGSALWLCAVSELKHILRDFQPDLVLLPWRRDPHRDHRDSWRLTMEALEDATPPVRTLEYTIWLDELGLPEDQPQGDEAVRLGLDIAGCQQTKIAAVNAHLSQTTDLINDDPNGFRLSPETIRRLCGRTEYYWASA